MTLAEILEAALEGRLTPYHQMKLAAFVPESFRITGYEVNVAEGWAMLHLSEPRKLLGRSRDTLDVNDGTVHRAYVAFDVERRPLAVYLFAKQTLV